MSRFLSVYITLSSRAEAKKIASVLVKEKLAACVNILPGLHSVYRWQGKIEKAREVALIAKTRATLFARLEKKVKALHSYQCPCIVAWGIEKGHKPFLVWIEKETKK